MTGPEGEREGRSVSDDARLSEAYALFERAPFTVLSLDVFDTLLWRTVPEPVDAFVLFGSRLGHRGQLASHVSPHLFARLRERAERKARRLVQSAGGLPEVTLEAIYEELPAHLFRGVAPADLPEEEVGFERDITFPDLDVLQFAEVAQKKFGARIVLVSDTYFSNRQLQRIVDREAFDSLEFDRIFTSSQYATGKGSGLYKVVLDTLGVPPEQVLHIGDNREADVERSRAHGIRAVHFEKFPEEFKTVLEREGLARGDDRQRVKPTLDLQGGDFGLTALRSKTLGRRDDLGVEGRSNGYWAFGASVFGPVFTAFAEWVHRRAQAEGVDTVYCIMREGEFLTRLVNGAKGYLGSPVWARPLWLSRQVCSRAAIGEATTDELSDFLHRRVPPTLRSFCASVGVELAELPDLNLDGDPRLDDPELAHRLLKGLTEQPELRKAILSRAGTLRGRLVDYVLNTVGTTEKPLVLVDIGWGGTIQMGLDRSLALAGTSLDTIGLYLLTNDGVLERTLDGLRAEGFLASGGLPHDTDWVTRTPEILEQVCMHDSGSLVDFTPEGEPVHEAVSQSPSQMLQRTAVQGGILAFQRQWSRYSSVVPAEARTLDARAHPQLRKMISRFTASPTTEEAALFGGWLHDDNYGSEETETLAPAAMAPSLRYMTPRQLLELPMTKLLWPVGLAALHDETLAVTASAVADGVLPPEAFDSGQPCRVHIGVNPGDGFREVLCRPAGPNRNGLSYLGVEIGGRPIREVMLRCFDGPAVVRVDWLRLSFSLQGHGEPAVVCFDQPEDFGPLRFGSAVALADNVLLGASEAPALVYQCPSEWTSSVYKVEIEMRFAGMPLSPMRRPAASNGEIVAHLAERVARRLKKVWHTSAREANERFRPKA
ncbi:MAG: hypothetical protein M3203_00525 [Actinomycetota bacterium]|nr:hypothetical protein [Actinomycetota bacterium]